MCLVIASRMSSAGLSLSSLLPAPSQPSWDRDEERAKEKAEAELSDSKQVATFEKSCPPYGKRKGFIPR